MNVPDHTNDSQQRILKILMVMFGHELDGLPPGQIARLVGCPPSSTTRDLYNLLKAGLAEQVPRNGNYRIAPLIRRRNTFTMAQFAESVDRFLSFNEYEILEGKGKVSKKQAEEKAREEYSAFNKTQRLTSDFDREVQKMIAAKKK